MLVDGYPIMQFIFLSATSGYIRYYVGWSVPNLMSKIVPNLMSKIFFKFKFFCSQLWNLIETWDFREDLPLVFPYDPR